MAEYRELGGVEIRAAVEYRAVKSLSITEKQDGHGRLKLQLVQDSARPVDLSRLEQSPIEVRTREGERVFCGVCIDYGTERLGQYRELYIEAVTSSYLADITPRSLTFQSESKTLQSILEQVLGPYGVLLMMERNPAVPQMIYQQNETDWAFAKRIANQYGMSLFVNGKARGFQVHVGAVPFSVRAVGVLPDEVVEKDIQALRVQRRTAAPELMAYEVERHCGAVAEPELGVGHALEKDGRTFIIVSSEITSTFGLLVNRIQCVSRAGALPAPAAEHAGRSGGTESPRGRAPSLHSSNIISGQVLEVSGNDVKVRFDSGSGDRWIPYASALSDCMYVMPDVGDTVFCYFENDGVFVCLGSRHVDNSRSDFDRPEEKVLTSKNRMIRFRGDGLDLTGSRSEMDGEGGMQLKITLSDENGVEIAATKDVTFCAKGKIFIQGVEQEPDDPAQSQTILNGQAAKAAELQGAEKEGADYQTAHGGAPEKLSLWGMSRNALTNLVGDIYKEVKSTFNTVGSWFKPLGGGGSEAADNGVEFEEVEDRQILIFGLKRCELKVQESSLVFREGEMFGGSEIRMQTPEFHELGFYRGRTYETMAESTNTLVDTLLDGIQLGLDIIGIIGIACPVVGVVTGALNAAISLLRGDFAGAALNLIGCIPGGSMVKLAKKAEEGSKLLKAGVSVLKWLGKGADAVEIAQLTLGVDDAVESVQAFFVLTVHGGSFQEWAEVGISIGSQAMGYAGARQRMKNHFRDAKQRKALTSNGPDHNGA